MTKRSRLFAMAALLVLPLAACDEGEDGLGPGANGTITGQVSVDGAAHSGATVTLSSGSTATTGSDGRYTFSDVPTGAYVVTVSPISGVTFSSPAQTATISTPDQTVTVDFAGSAIRTSAIAVSVQGSSGPLAGVTVTLSGAGSGTQTTGSGGLASFTGLAAGNYTVTISGVPSGQVCASTSQSTTVAAGETRSLSFTCASSTTASITGRLFIDENDQNNVFDGEALEDNLAAANVAITLEGPNVGITQTVQTDASGNFSFMNLAEGQYNVTIDSDDPDLPDEYGYGLASETVGPITLAGGGTASANFPFDILNQTITAYAFLGRDANAATGVSSTIPTGVAPLEGVILDLFANEADAIADANRLGSDTTDAGGMVSFTFLRTADTGPSGTGQDRIVFAEISTITANPVPAGHSVNGEMRMEIAYDGRTQTTAAPDTFDLLNLTANLKVDVYGPTGGPLAGWDAELFADDTTAAALIETVQTDADGRASFSTYTAATIGDLPDTLYVWVPATGQAAAGTHGFTRTNTPEHATVRGSYLRYAVQGTLPADDTVDVGDVSIRFTDTDVEVRVHHEADDSTAPNPLFTVGDETNDGGSANIEVTMSWREPDATADSVRDATDDVIVPDAATGLVTFTNVPIFNVPYRIEARTTAGTQFVLEEDTLFSVTLNGDSIVTPICSLEGSAGCSTFAYKYENTMVSGTVLAADGTEAEDIQVRVRADPRTVQPRPTDTTVVVDAAGAYSVTGMREGLYIVSILHDSVTADGDSIWAFFGNTADTVDLEDSGGAAVADFTATRMDTEIQGVIVNDRDEDANTVDPGEGLGGVTLELYTDNDGTITIDEDSLVATTTTDANGRYGFSKLREGTYAVKVQQSVAGAVVLRRFSGTGTVVDTAIVHTMAAAAALCEDADDLRRVGTNDLTCFSAGNPLPRWDYANSVALNVDVPHFTFLYSTGTVTGQVEEADGTDVAGMTMTLNRCLVSPAQPSPPAAGTCTSFFPGFMPINVNTGTNGSFSFTGLQEGVYQVTSNPATAGYTSTNPTSMLYTISGNNDVETGAFTAVP